MTVMKDRNETGRRCGGSMTRNEEIAFWIAICACLIATLG